MNLFKELQGKVVLIIFGGLFSLRSTMAIGVIDFKVGMAIETVFITPSSGRVALNLQDAQDNIYLHVNPRWDTHALVLNSRLNGTWGTEERPGGFDFSSGVPTTIRVEAFADHFKILNNGKVLQEYKYRSFDITKIVKATLTGDGTLISLTVGF